MNRKITDEGIKKLIVMKQQGHTIKDIATAFNISRARVVQLTHNIKSTELPNFYTENQIIEQLSLTEYKFSTLIKQLDIRPKIVGNKKLYSKRTLKILELASKKACVICGKIIPSNHEKYCEECSEKVRTPSERYKIPEERERQKQRSTAWMKRNPEKVKIIRQKAAKKYRDKQLAKIIAENSYVVRRSYPNFTIGEIFKIVDIINHKLTLADGRAIPAAFTQKLKDSEL